MFSCLAEYHNITLVIYTGPRDPSWIISSESPKYPEIQALLLQARNSGFVYPHICLPPKTGYKGYIVEDSAGEQVIVGPETVQLQLLLLDTMPSNLPLTPSFRQRIRSEISSGTVIADCPSVARHKRFAPKYQPGLWNGENVRKNNNCYNYATTMITNTKAQPGQGSEPPKIARTVAAAVMIAAMRDGMELLNPHPGPNDPVPKAPKGDRHLVALVWDDGKQLTKMTSLLDLLYE